MKTTLGRACWAIALMAVATYLTRIGGYLLLGGRELSPRIMTMLDTVPGCVLVAVIARPTKDPERLDAVMRHLEGKAAVLKAVLGQVRDTSASRASRIWSVVVWK